MNSSLTAAKSGLPPFKIAAIAAACAVWLAGSVASVRGGIPGTTLLEAVDILPGPDVYAPQLMALNHASHKLYVAGSHAPGVQNYGLRVINTASNQLTTGIDLGRYASQYGPARVSADALTVDESTTAGGNRVYALIQSPSNGLAYLRIINGATDTPLTGEGTDVLFSSSDYPYPQVGMSSIVVNPSNHKVYYVDRNGRVAVVDGPNRKLLTSFTSGVGLGPQFMVVNPAANKVFIFGRSGAAIINSSTDTPSPVDLGGFVPTAGAYDSGNGRVYLIGIDSSNANRIVALDSNGASVLSVPIAAPHGARGITVDPLSGTVYLAAPSLSLSHSGTISAYRASDLAFQHTFNRGAGFLLCDPAKSGRLYFLDYNGTAAAGELRNSVGVLTPSDSTLSKITVGYRPYQLAVNSQTNRIYVADEQAPEMVVLDAESHDIAAHVAVASAQTGALYAEESTERYIAVSEALNRVYLSGASENFDTGARTGYVYVFNGATNQLIQTITASTLGSVGFIAVDDSGKHLYVTAGLDLLTYDLNTNAFIRKTTMPAPCNGLSVNPTNGRVYYSEGSGYRRLQIVNGATGVIVSTVSNASEAYRSAVNKATGKVFVVNNANAVTVVNGATDSYETGFANTYRSQFGDNVFALLADDGTNRVYLLDQANGNGLTGFLTAYDGSKNTYPFIGEVDLGRFPTDIQACTSNRQIFVTNNQDGTISALSLPPAIFNGLTAEAVAGEHFAYKIDPGQFTGPVTYSVDGLPQGFALRPTGYIVGNPQPGSETTNPITITIHVTGGKTTVTTKLRLTISNGTPVLTVTDSGIPAGVSAGNRILQFSAKYPGKLARQTVALEVNEAGTWHPLGNGSDGFMTYDAASQRYVLNSTSYPAGGSVSFRAHVTAPGHPETIVSNVVGPMNLASATPRAGQTLFKLIRNGEGADFDFEAVQIAGPSGVAVRVQMSSTPSDEGSWADLQGASGGHMASTDGTHFFLLMNKVPASASGAVYFRAVGSKTGSVDALSNITGPYVLIADTPPSVRFTSPSGSGDLSAPVMVTVDSAGTARFTIAATATSSRNIKSLSLLYDSQIIATVRTGGTTVNASVPYQTDRIGDHLVEAIAVDDLGATARAGTHPLVIRVAPAGAASTKQLRRADGVGASETAAPGQVYTLVKSGFWQDPTVWVDSHGNNGVPGANDLALVNTYSVQIQDENPHNVAGWTVGSVSIRDGHLIGNSGFGGGVLTVLKMATISGGSGEKDAGLGIADGAVCEMINDSDFEFHDGGTIINHGTLLMHGRGGILGLTFFRNQGTSEFRAPLIPVDAPLDRYRIPRKIVSNRIELAGGLISGKDALLRGSVLPVVSNDGNSVVSNDGNSLISQDGGTLVGNNTAAAISDNGAGLISQDGGTLITNDGGTLITNDGGTLVSENGAGLVGNSGGTLVGNSTAARTANRRAVTAPSGLLQSGGELDLNGVTIAGPLTMNGGILSGTGLIIGSLTNNGGYVSPGHSAGSLVITGNYTQGPSGTMILEAAEGGPGQFDQIQVAGTAKLGGKLDLRTINGYVPLPNDAFNPLGYKSVSGSFGSVSSNAKVTLNPTGLLSVIDPAKPNPQGGRLLNISTRMRTETGENVLIGGFYITGTAPKKVLIRAIGPSLPVSGALADPVLELHKADGTVVTNDNWKSNQEAEIRDTTVPPSRDLESAIVVTLPPGGHTAIVRGKDNGTGVALVEVYDLGAAAPEQLANISTRGQVQTGDNVMIGGFIVGGGEPAKVLIRAIGPSLPVSGKLQDTLLELHDSNGSTLINDDWRATQEAEIIATTIPPSDNRESAMIATLPSGNYTAVVRGKDNSTGVGLVEAYNLQ